MSKRFLSFFNKPLVRYIAAPAFVVFGALTAPVALAAGGDLLVAPTRIVLNGSRGTEVILNNIGTETATYRVSLVLRRMTKEGQLDEVTKEEANDKEAQTLSMIRYAPRRVTLPPNQPQAIRIGARAPANIPDGEYRAHMLFRAIPKARSNVDQPANNGTFAIALIPIYGVTIPIIVRKGNLQATAAIANGRLTHIDKGPAISFELSRAGDSSVYGEIRVMKPGVSEPLLVARGIAVYDEIHSRTVTLPVPKELADSMQGTVSIEYYHPANAGGGLITKSTLQLGWE